MKKYTLGSIQLVLLDRPSRAIKDLIKNTVLGTPGGIRYAHAQQKGKLEKLPNAKFLALQMGTRTLGCICLVRRKFINSPSVIHTDLVRYLSIKSLMRDNHHQSSTKNTTSKGKLKGVIKTLFNDLPQIQQSEDSDYLLYAHVDSHNSRSYNLVESMGFEKYRSFQTTLFSRFFASKDSQFALLEGRHLEEAKLLIQSQYKDHSFFDLDLVEVNRDLYGLIENNKVIACVKVRPSAYKVVEIPGIGGKILLNWISKLPYLSKKLNPEELKFLAFEAISVQEGKEGKIASLLESCCAEYKRSVGMYFMDTEDKLYKYLVPKGRNGIVNGLLRFKPAALLIRKYKLSAENENFLRSNPTFVSTFDVI